MVRDTQATNLLRDILDTNPRIAMLREIFTPSAAPANWDKFATLYGSERPEYPALNKLLHLFDKCFAFVEYRIRNRWSEGDTIPTHRKPPEIVSRSDQFRIRCTGDHFSPKPTFDRGAVRSLSYSPRQFDVLQANSSNET